MKSFEGGLTENSNLRADIQGLRAVAVALVIGYHFIGRPAGGFVGVDVFFVISGFLIGGGLLRSAISGGGIDLKAFYWRRFWRLAPASAIVLLVTALCSVALLSKEVARSVGLDAMWAALISANWRFATTGVEYSNADAADSPLLHFWSLAVEEQFYLLAPVLAIVLIPVVKRSRRPWLTATVVAAVFTVSLTAVAAWSTQSQPAVAYFATYARAWELAAGALAAALVRVIPSIRRWLRTSMVLGGLGLIAASVVVVDYRSAFPYPWAAPAVLGAFAVLVAGHSGKSTWILENPIARYIGDRSYSLYLWHFPVNVFVETFRVEHKIIGLVIAMLVTFGMAELSYSLVEAPLRGVGHGRRPSWSIKGASRWLASAALVGVIAGVVGLGSWVLWRPAPVVSPADVSEVWGSPVGPIEQERIDLVSAALESRSWADRASVVDSAEFPAEWDFCFMPWGEEDAREFVKTDACTWGPENATTGVFIVGDSIALSMIPAVRTAYPDARVRALTPGQCPMWDVEVRTWNRDRDPAECEATREVVIETLEAEKPDLVIVVSAVSTLKRLESGATGDAALAEWQDGMGANLERLSASAKELVILDAPPTASSTVAECAWRYSRPSDCFHTYSGADRVFAAAQREVVDAADLANVFYPPTAQWYCDSSGRCPVVIGGVAVVADTGHLSETGSEGLGPLLAERVPLPGSR